MFRNKRLPVVVILLAATTILISAFAKKNKTITTGAGKAGTTAFKFSAVQTSDGHYAGEFTWNGKKSRIVCVYHHDKAATIYLNDGRAVTVVDNEGGDMITTPFEVQYISCGETLWGPGDLVDVSSGNVTVNE